MKNSYTKWKQLAVSACTGDRGHLRSRRPHPPQGIGLYVCMYVCVNVVRAHKNQPLLSKINYVHHRVQRIDLYSKRWQTFIFTSIDSYFGPLMTFCYVLRINVVHRTATDLVDLIDLPLLLYRVGEKHVYCGTLTR